MRSSRPSPNRRLRDPYRRSAGGRERHLRSLSPPERNRQGGSVERRDFSNPKHVHLREDSPYHHRKYPRREIDPSTNRDKNYSGSDSSKLDEHGMLVRKSHQFDDVITTKLFTTPSNQVLDSGELTPGCFNRSLYENGHPYHRERLTMVPSKDYHQEEEKMTYRHRNVSYPMLPVSSCLETAQKEEPLAHTNICNPYSGDGHHKSNPKFSDSSSHEPYSMDPDKGTKDLLDAMGSPSYSRREHPNYGYTEAGRQEMVNSAHPSDDMYRMMQPSDRGGSENRVSSRKRSIDMNVDAVNHMKCSHRRLGEGNLWEHQALVDSPVPKYLSITTNGEHSSTGSKYLEFGARVTGAHQTFAPSGGYGFGMGEAPGMYKERLSTPPIHECDSNIYRLDASHQQNLKAEEVDAYGLLNRVQGRKSSIDEEVQRHISRSLSSSSGDISRKHELADVEEHCNEEDIEDSMQGIYPSLKVEDRGAYGLLDRVQGRKSTVDEEVRRHDSRILSSSSRDIFRKYELTDVEEHCNEEDIEASMQGRYPSLKVEYRYAYGSLDRVQGRKSAVDEEVRRYDSRTISSNSRDISRKYELTNVEEHCSEEDIEASMQGRYPSLKVEDRDAYGLLDRVQGRKSTVDEEVRRYDSRTLSSNSRDNSRKHELADIEEHCNEEGIEARMQGGYQSLVEDRDAYRLLNRVQGRKSTIDEEVIIYDFRTLNSRDISRKHELANVEEHCNEEDVEALRSHKASVFSRLEHKKIERTYDERASGRGPASQRLSSAHGRGFATKPGTSNRTKKGLKPASLNLLVPNDHSSRHIETSQKRKADDRHNRVDAENDDPAKGQVLRLKNDAPEASPNFKQLVQKAFLRFSKHLNETSAQRRRYTEQGKAGSLICSICGSLAKEFADTRSLASHAYMSLKGDTKADHLGLHKALCVLMGWNSDFVTGNTWKKQVLPNDEALAQKENLILWPPLVIIHNSSIGGKNPDEQNVVTIEEMDAMLRDLGFSTSVTKVCRGKPANQSIMVVKFTPTYSGLQEAERLHQYYAKNKRGRGEFQRMSSDSENSKGAEGGKLELVLYGYLGISGDLDKLEIETKKRCVVESKKDILGRALKSE